MNRELVCGIAAGVLAAGMLGLSPGRVGTARPDNEALAHKLVTVVAGIHEGDLVMVTGGPKDTELLENIAVEVRKVGAFPLVTYGSDRLTKRLVTEVPAKYDSQAPALEEKLAGIVTAIINVEYNETESLMADVAPERLAAMRKASQPIMSTLLKRNVRLVSLGNGLNPTEAHAKRYGVSRDELSKIYWDAVNADYSALQATGEEVKGVLGSGSELHLTNPNGTDLTLKIKGRHVYVSDGVISAADVKTGGAACQAWLPAGEVYVTPTPGTAEGTVVVERAFYQGKEITGLTLTFKAGRLTTMSAKSGIEPLQKAYDAAGKGKDEFAIIDIGINPSVPASASTRLQNWVQAGMVSVGFGDNSWAGGDNKCDFDMTGFVPGSTLTVDGKAIVDKGTLKTSK